MFHLVLLYYYETKEGHQVTTYIPEVIIFFYIQNEFESTIYFSIFGIPIIADDNINDSVIDFILLQSMTNSNMDEFPNVIPEEEMRNYLYYVSNIKVQFSAEASALLNSYFVATRMNTPGANIDLFSENVKILNL